jgi:hypothetical protein
VLEPIEGFAENVVALRGVGTITADDYRDVLGPAVEAATANDRRARLLLVMGEEFTGYDAGAFMADAGLGASHFGSFDRIAVVTDEGWLRGAIHMFGGLTPGDVRLFAADDATAAADWIRG